MFLVCTNVTFLSHIDTPIDFFFHFWQIYWIDNNLPVHTLLMMDADCFSSYNYRYTYEQERKETTPLYMSR